MTDGYKIKRVLIWQNGEEKQVYPAENKIVFDFQNDGLQGCTLSNTQNFGYESGQGIYGAASFHTGCNITLPSSTFGKALKSVIMNVYYSSGGMGNGFGMYINGGYSFRYSEQSSNISSLGLIGFADGKSSPNYNVGAKNGELTIIYNLSDGVISGKVGGTTYSINDSYANNYINSFINGSLLINFTCWGNSNRSYIRKLTFITE